MDKIKVFLADDHVMLREAIRLLLENVPDIEIVGEAGDGLEAVANVAELVPDVVLMDIVMPGLDGLEATRQIKEKTPHVKVLILTMYETDQYLRLLLQLGASGYVVKTAGFGELLSAVRAVYRGDLYLCPAIARVLVRDYLQKGEAGEGDSDGLLTRREKEVVSLVAEGKKNQEIANLLGITPRTVEAHRTSSMRKLGAHNGIELVKYAISKGIVNL